MRKEKPEIIFEWKINNNPLKVVNNFVYLGNKFSSNGMFNEAIKALNEQALKTYNHLISIFSRVTLDSKTKLYLFDMLVEESTYYNIWL